MRHTLKRLVLGLAALSAIALPVAVTAANLSGAADASRASARVICPNDNSNWDDKPCG
jgi:hypothetical protein